MEAKHGAPVPFQYIAIDDYRNSLARLVSVASQLDIILAWPKDQQMNDSDEGRQELDPTLK